MSDTSVHPSESRPSQRWVMRASMVLLIFVVTTICLFWFSTPSLSGTDSVAFGKPAPQIELVELTTGDSLVGLDSMLDEKVVLLHFWGTWCGPCAMEYPELSRDMASNQSENEFRFVPISCQGGSGETLESLNEKTQSFLRRKGIDDVAFADVRGITQQSLLDRLERTSLFYPTSILIDQRGKIAGVWEGYVPGYVEAIQIAIERQLQDAH